MNIGIISNDFFPFIGGFQRYKTYSGRKYHIHSEKTIVIPGGVDTLNNIMVARKL